MSIITRFVRVSSLLLLITSTAALEASRVSAYRGVFRPLDHRCSLSLRLQREPYTCPQLRTVYSESSLGWPAFCDTWRSTPSVPSVRAPSLCRLVDDEWLVALRCRRRPRALLLQRPSARFASSIVLRYAIADAGVRGSGVA